MIVVVVSRSTLVSVIEIYAVGVAMIVVVVVVVVPLQTIFSILNHVIGG